MKKRIKKRTIVFSVILCILAVGFIYQTISVMNYKSEISGEIVKVNGKEMHIKISGENNDNKETIVLISGMGDGHLLWSGLQNKLSEHYKVISYDPSGFGYSHSNQQDKSSQASAEELYNLLMTAGIKPPYILVGHSNGGFTARVFEAMYEGDVKGMVLVDSTYEKMVSGNTAAIFYKIQGGVYSVLGVLNYFGIPRILVDLFGSNLILEGLELDKEIEEQYIESYFNSATYFSIAKQCFSLPDSLKQISAISKDLGNMPLSVLYSIDGVEEDKDEIAIFFNELASMSTDSEVVIVENSGHYIHIDQQKKVFEAILKIAEASRK